MFVQSTCLHCAGIVKHPEFMPFASPTSPTREHLRPLPGINERTGLRRLLCGHIHDQNEWLRQAKEYLWANRVPKVSAHQQFTDISSALPL